MSCTPNMKAVALGTILVAAIACSPVKPVDQSQPASASSETKPKAFIYTIDAVPVETLNATGPRIERTASGVATKLIRAGSGTRHPTADDGVVLYSQVYDETGKVKARWDGFIGDPANEETAVGWELLQMMVEGEVRRVWLPDAKAPDGVNVADYELTWITPRPRDAESATSSAERTSTK